MNKQKIVSIDDSQFEHSVFDADTLLSVDFDFFFPIPEHDVRALYDWGHSEDLAAIFGESIWYIRAAQFISSKQELPRLSENYEKFWARFNFASDCVLYLADSHKFAAVKDVRKDIKLVLNFDAHHDCYTTMTESLKRGGISCEDWTHPYLIEKRKVRWVYPSWAAYRAKDDKPKHKIEVEQDTGFTLRRTIKRIFVCRSGSWVASWLDNDFDKFVAACPVERRVYLQDVKNRNFDIEEAKKVSKHTDEILARHGAAQ